MIVWHCIAVAPFFRYLKKNGPENEYCGNLWILRKNLRKFVENPQKIVEFRPEDFLEIPASLAEICGPL